MRKLIVLFIILAQLSGCATLGSWLGLDDSKSNVGKIPSRKSSALSGSAFVSRIRNMTGDQRERAIFEQIAAGNIPQSMRRLKPIKLQSKSGSKTYSGTIWVMPDYLAIGSDSDYVMIPMTPITAQRIADRFGFLLPTRKLVNDIYQQAQVKLTPKPLPPGRSMTTTSYYDMHNKLVKKQLGWGSSGKLIAGHKKDIVITNLLNRRPYRVAIYGWHRGNGRPIQPLSLVHGNTYADYSHGVRLVWQIMRVGKKNMYVRDVLKDRDLSRLISDEGTIRNPRLRLSSSDPKSKSSG